MCDNIRNRMKTLGGKMKKIYILLQVAASIYCGQMLMDWYHRDMYQLMSLICIHLILYLISSVVRKPFIKHMVLGADIIYLVIILLAGNNYELFMVLFLVALEFVSMDTGFIKKLGVAGITLWIGSVFIDFIVADWLIYSTFLILTIFIYFNEERVKVLTDTRDTLMVQVNSLNKLLEGVKQEKKQMAYITQVTERNKLAQALHDKVGHLLAGNIMQLEAIKIILPRDKDKGMLMIEQVADSLRGGMEEIRHTLKGIKPASSENGLTQIKEELQIFQSKTGIKPKLIYVGDLESIDLEMWQAIILNLRETVTNFIKYSKGDAFSISIEVMNKFIKVRFKDNGLVEQTLSKNLGLMGIEERTLNVGGKLIINTDEGFETIMLISR